LQWALSWPHKKRLYTKNYGHQLWKMLRWVQIPMSLHWAATKKLEASSVLNFYKSKNTKFCRHVHFNIFFLPYVFEIFQRIWNQYEILHLWHPNGFLANKFLWVTSALLKQNSVKKSKTHKSFVINVYYNYFLQQSTDWPNQIVQIVAP